MNTKLPVRPVHDERITIPMPAEEKRRIFEAAATRGVTVSELVRNAVAATVLETTDRRHAA